MSKFKYFQKLILSCLLIIFYQGCDDEGEESPPISGKAQTEGAVEGGAVEGGAVEGGAQAGMTAEGGSEGGTGGTEVHESCIPAPEGKEEASTFLQEHCGLCHGATPQYGAPFSLINIDELLNETDRTKLERSMARLIEGTMPPTGQPQPSSDRAQAFIDWATCGQGPQRLTPPGGFEVTRPRYPSAGAPPEGAEIKALTATSIRLDPDITDQYRCFLYQGPGLEGEERGIVRFEPSIDNARIVHHIVLYEAGEALALTEDGAEVDCGAGLGAAIYAWAPGQGALHFTQGALVSGGDKRYLLEIHYNNSARLDDLIDSSGVKLYHTAPQEPRIDMMTLGPEGFTLPAQARTEVSGYCEIQEDLTVIALMPHMHELGVDLSSTIRRNGATQEDWEDLISLRGWDFNFQLTYDAQGTTLHSGDLVKTTCLFQNDSNRSRRYGAFTEDEMCYQFAYVTPPPQSRRCDQPEEGLEYIPGSCAPAEAINLAQAVRGSYHIGVPPTPQGGMMPSSPLPMTQVDIWFAQENLGPITINPDASWFEGAGVYSYQEDILTLDLQGVSNAVSIQGATFMLPMEISFSAQVESGSDLNHLSITPICPEMDQTRTISYSANAQSFTIFQPFNQPVEGTLIVTFGTP